MNTGEPARGALRTLPWIVIAVAAFIFLAPNTDLAADLQWNDGQRLAQLVLLAFVALSLIGPGTLRSVADVWASLPLWGRTALCFAFVLGFLSSLMAPLSRWAWLELGHLWLLLMLALAFAAQYRRFEARLDRPLVVMLFAMAAAYTISAGAVYVVMLSLGPAYGQVFDIRELYVSFSNIRFFGHIQTMVLPFLLLPAMWWGTTRWRRVVLWSVPAIWWMLVIASGTRGTWIALLVGIVAVLLYGRGAGRRWLRWQMGGLLSGLLCYAMFILLIPWLVAEPGELIYRPGDILSLSLREVLWSTAMAFAVEHPVLGVGPMHYAYFAAEVAAHPHNAVLQWAAEWGTPAAILLTGTFAAAGLIFAAHVRLCVEVGEQSKGRIGVALLAALAGAAAQAMVDGVLVMPVSQTLLAMLCGWALGYYFLSAAGVRCGRGSQVLLAVTTLLAVAAVAGGVAPEIGHIADRERTYLATHPPGTPLLPRFWAQGWINE